MKKIMAVAVIVLPAMWLTSANIARAVDDSDRDCSTAPLSRDYKMLSKMLTFANPAFAGFGIRKISNRVLTPNGDNKNDKVVFKFDNDADLEFAGKIFDLRGALVAHMSPGPEDDSLQWDGKRNGRVVPSGIYIYRIWAQDKVFTGTILVIR